MKKLILIIICFVSLQLSAQGNLQFNQVHTFTGTISVFGGGAVLSPVQTVPSGKVWKIEHVGGTHPLSSVEGNFGLYINNATTWIHNQNNAGTVLWPFGVIWLKEGDQVRYIASGGSATANNSWDYVISIIEFNIVP